jgi:hypothetical protein
VTCGDAVHVQHEPGFWQAEHIKRSRVAGASLRGVWGGLGLLLPHGGRRSLLERRQALRDRAVPRSPTRVVLLIRLVVAAATEDEVVPPETRARWHRPFRQVCRPRGALLGSAVRQRPDELRLWVRLAGRPRTRAPRRSRPYLDRVCIFVLPWT